MTTQDAQDARDKANDYLAGQIGRIDTELEALRKVMRDEVVHAIETAIMRAVSNPELYTAASAAIQAQARQHAGGWLFRGAAGLASKAGWIAVTLLAVYSLGGFPAVIAMLKAWASGASS